MLCEELNPDILVVTEHGFDDNNINHFKIHNYQLANFHCRTSAKGGGVAVFLKNSLRFTPYRPTESTDKIFEVSGVKITTNKTNLLIIGLYRSPSRYEESFFQNFENLLSNVTKRGGDFVIVGDFNINTLDVDNPTTGRLRDLLRSFGLVWSVDSPTRVTDHSATAIDNVVTNLTDSGVSVIDTAISDHYAQLVVIGSHEPKLDPITGKTVRITKPANVTLLNSLLSKESWSFLNSEDPIEQQFSTFMNTFNYHLDVSCPIVKKQQKQKHNKCAWITKGILVSREKLRFLSEIKNHTSNGAFNQFFLNYKRIYKKVIKAAKAYDVNKALLTSTNVSKTAWAIINDKDTATDKQIKLQIENELISDPLRVADAFNRFFASVGSDQGLCPSGDQPPSFSDQSPMASMALSSVTEEEVARMIRDLKSKRSYDSNHMSTWLLKQCSTHLIGPLTHLINFSLHSGTFPTPLKTAKVTPVFKKGDPLAPQNYRPISMLPVFSKIFEKAFLNRCVSFLDKQNLLNDNQFGFRSGRSTTDGVGRLVDMIMEGIEGRENTLGVFLDLSKAFDCVDHGILKRRLEHCGIRGLPLRWLESYLSDRNQVVTVANVSSGGRELRYGVPQGSILSPLLFLIYVNDVGSSVHSGQLVQYADDTTLCFKATSSNELEKLTFLELNSIIQKFNQLNLRTNATKSTFIQFGLRHFDSEHTITVMVDETEIEEVYTSKFLGIHLDRGLNWEYHVDSICSKLSSGIFVLRQLAKYCPTQILMTAYYGIIYPHLTYGIAMWGGCANSLFSRIFILQKKAIRIIAKLKRRESCRPTFKQLKLLTLPCLYILQTCVFFKTKCEHVRGSDIHPYATRGREDYRTGRHRTVAYEQLPSQAGARFVNRLPNSIKSATMPKAFKNRLKTLLIDKAFYSTDEFMAQEWEI